MVFDFHSISDIISGITTDSLLLVLALIIVASWLYLFLISIRSYLLTPSIFSEKKQRQRMTSTSSNLQYTKDKKIIKPIENKDRKNVSPDDLAFCYEKDTCHQPSTFPFVSVIVPARNEQDNIERCILSLLGQNYPNFEVIAIDDNSTDNTLDIMQNIKSRETNLQAKTLMILSLTDKPDDWTGKTWASQQGYLKSSGNVLLFTDADTYFSSTDTILLTILYMQKKDLDVLTGIPYIELRDFWSKITMPVWNHFSILLGANTACMNNPKCKAAYLNGSFIMINRKVFEEIGTYQSVRKAIQEDKSLGVRIKEAGYTMKIVRIDKIMSALWSRDLHTLWHGIGRTLAPMNRMRIVMNLLIIFFMVMLPFLITIYTLSIAVIQQQFEFVSTLQFHIDDFHSIVLFLIVVSSIIVIAATAIKDVKKYKITPIYSLLSFLGAVFLMAGYIANIIPLLISDKVKSIVWRGRKQRYNRKEEEEGERFAA
jgi:chlorobactene glucosyltransferase